MAVFLRGVHAQAANYGGSFPIPDDDHYGLVLIGMIMDPELSVPDGQVTTDSIKERLGQDSQLFVQPLAGREGFIGHQVFYGIIVKTYDEAKAIAAFAPLGMFSGYNMVIPPKQKRVVEERDSVEKIELEAQFPLPYEDDGAYIVSCIPAGLIASYIFLKEDLPHVYYDKGPMIGQSRADTVARIRATFFPKET